MITRLRPKIDRNMRIDSAELRGSIALSHSSLSSSNANPNGTYVQNCPCADFSAAHCTLHIALCKWAPWACAGLGYVADIR